MKWQDVYEANNQLEAEALVLELRKYGVFCRVHPSDVSSFLGVGVLEVRIQASTEDAKMAQDIICELFDNPQAEADEP